MTEEDTFQAALDANPDDHFTRVVFADWLEERGDKRAKGYRWLGMNGSKPVKLVFPTFGRFGEELQKDQIWCWPTECLQSFPKVLWRKIGDPINEFIGDGRYYGAAFFRHRFRLENYTADLISELIDSGEMV